MTNTAIAVRNKYHAMAEYRAFRPGAPETDREQRIDDDRDQFHDEIGERFGNTHHPHREQLLGEENRSVKTQAQMDECDDADDAPAIERDRLGRGIPVPSVLDEDKKARDQQDCRKRVEVPRCDEGDKIPLDCFQTIGHSDLRTVVRANDANIARFQRKGNKMTVSMAQSVANLATGRCSPDRARLNDLVLANLLRRRVFYDAVGAGR